MTAIYRAIIYRFDCSDSSAFAVYIDDKVDCKISPIYLPIVIATL